MTQLWRRLAISQTRYPGRYLLVFGMIAAVGVWLASRLELVTNFADLLSPDQPSVVELRKLQTRTRGYSKVLVVLEGSDLPALRQAADAIVPPLRAIGPPWIESAASGVQETRRFMMPRAGLYLAADKLAELEERVVGQEQKVFRQAIGADLSEDEPEDATKPAAATPTLEQQLLTQLGRVDRYPDGYFQLATPTGYALVVVAKSSIGGGDLDRAKATAERVRAVVSTTLSRLPAPARDVHVGYAGDLLTSMAEYDLVRRDVLDVGGVGLVLVLGVVLLFFRTARAWVTLGATIAVGSALTFGVTELTIGHLNVVTAFVFSIVAGNGINFGIIWLARFLEERRAGRAMVNAIARTSIHTWGATITAAAAGGVAYAALAISSVRGFQHLAVIGGVGMLLCWAVTYTLLPAIVVLFQRLGHGWRAERHTGIRFERPFVWLVGHAPRTTVIASLCLALVSAVAGGLYLRRGAIEYDMRRLQSDRKVTGELYRVSHLATRVLGAGPGGGMLVLADDARDVPALAAALRRVRDQAPADLRPFQEVHTIADVVPEGQIERLERVRALARRLTRIHERGGIDDESWAKIAPYLPTPEVVPFTAADLPQELAEPFTEKDGTRGRLVYIEQTAGQSDNDLHYLLRLVNAFRATRLPDGRVVQGSGAAVIFADLLHASLFEMPRSVMISLGMVALTVVLMFRRARPVVLVLSSLGMALIWMMGGLAAANVHLNFINFIALPITFGIGIDYPVNVYARYAEDRAAGVVAALLSSGGAIILCSLTTNLGYIALLRSGNAAVRSLGAVAVLGETTCLLAAVAALPAFIAWADARKRAARAPALGQPRARAASS